MLAIAVAFGVLFLLCMHISFLYKNETTIESVELSGGNRFKLNNSSHNVSQIMGNNYWFIPYMPTEEYKDKNGVTQKNDHYLNGLHYPTRD